MQTTALFRTKTAEPQTKQTAKVQTVKKSATPKINKAEEYEKKRTVLNRFTSALDFAEVRSKSDAELLYDAKYGDRGADGRMSRDQYRALARKVRGTAKDFFKESVEAKGLYVEKGYVSTEQTEVPGLPFLVATVLALFVAVGFVVANT